LSKLASIEDADGPNQITRDEGRRRIVISANAQGRALSEVVAELRAVVADFPLPEGYFITLGGQFQAQEEAAKLISLLALGSTVLIFMVLFSRYQSALLAGLIMANVPLALVGSVLGLWLSGQPLSVAALIGFITLAGIATRNGILKVSHYLNLMRFEGEVFGPDADYSRLARAPDAGIDDRAGCGFRAGAAALRGRAAGYRNPASGRSGDFFRPDQFNPA
jgi:HME family heavy-metal exporter